MMALDDFAFERVDVLPPSVVVSLLLGPRASVGSYRHWSVWRKMAPLGG